MLLLLLKIMRLSNEDISGSLIQVWKLLEATQTSCDLENMIAQEDGGLDNKSRNFALLPLYFELPH